MFRRKNSFDDDSFADYDLDADDDLGQRSSNYRKPLVVLLFFLLIVASGIGIYVGVILPTVVSHAERLGTELQKEICDMMMVCPQVDIDEKVYIMGTKPILELAVVQEEMRVDYEFEKTILFITSRLELEGYYRVKAGFDLNDSDFLIAIQDDDPMIITVTLPEPKILSSELLEYDVEADEGLLWSQITGQEREDAVNNMNAKARRMAQQGDFLELAKQMVESGIKDILQDEDVIVVFEYTR